jgi:hypothetical protein
MLYRMAVLEKLGHVDKDGLVTLKGRAACEVGVPPYCLPDLVESQRCGRVPVLHMAMTPTPSQKQAGVRFRLFKSSFTDLAPVCFLIDANHVARVKHQRLCSQ